MREIRKIILDDSIKGFDAFQSLYMNRETGVLIPNTEVWDGPHLAVKINSLGCKGEELVPNVPVIAILGDSGAFCISNDAWAQRMNIPGYQILNAGVEGYSLERMIAKYKILKEQIKIDILIVYGGWHNLIYNTNNPEGWRTLFDLLVSPDHQTMFCTLFTSLREECRTKGLHEFISAMLPPEKVEELGSFWFYGNTPYSLEKVNEIMDKMTEYHQVLKEFCNSRGIKIIDTNDFMLPKSYNEITKDFFDICHPRVPTYQKIAGFVEAQVLQLLNQQPQNTQNQASNWLGKLVGKITGNDTSSQSSTASNDKKIRDETPNIYPLW